MKKRALAILMALAVVLAFAGCSSQNPTASPSASPVNTNAMTIDKLKIGFIYVGPATDGGWSQAHDVGRQQAVAKYPGLQTIVKESVPETVECEQTIRSMIDQGCNVIFATSYGYQDYVSKVAKEFPKVQFFQATGSATAANLSEYNGRLYQARFLAGLVAGKRTKTNKVGYVAAMGIPEVVRGINAYALGVKTANPKATVEVKWTNSWVDPAAARACAESLLSKGCDVIGYHQDFTTPIVAAQDKGCWATGNNVSSVGVADKAYLTAPLMHWGTYYERVVGEMLDGTFKGGENYWGSLKEGMVSLDALTSNVTTGTKELVDQYTTKLTGGNWDVFTGEIKDQSGAVRVKAGEKMTDEQMLSFDWFVDNVIGSVK